MSKKRSKEKRRMPAAAEGAMSQRARSGSAGGNPIAEFFASKGVRETIESVAIAFVLAFLFRTFEAEAFVIPTGSMAHTLMGQHKDVVCQMCGYRHTAGASESQTHNGDNPVDGTICPMCRHQNEFENHDPAHPNYSGDRILVSKFIYDLQEPQRWDVVVFKFPNNAKQNYIKRLVGLPGETVRIQHGNLWTKPVDGDESQFRIARKPPGKIRAMLQEVHDTNHIPAALADKNLWPPRWDKPDGVEAGWQQTPTPVTKGEAELSRPTYSVAGVPGTKQWLRYRHYLPDGDDWKALRNGKKPEKEPSAQLISDFYSYNASLHNGNNDLQSIYGLHWVGDLAVQCDVDVKSASGKLLLDLVEAGTHYQCAIDVKTGEAVLSMVDIDGNSHPFNDNDLNGQAGDEMRMQVKGQTPVRGPGKYELMFAKVDHQLTLWVNGSVIAFDGSTAYVPANTSPDWNDADEGDLAPVGIGSEGATLDVTRLRVLRDIYYIADEFEPDDWRAAPFLSDYDVRTRDGDIVRLASRSSSQTTQQVYNDQQVRRILSDPRNDRKDMPNAFDELFAARRHVEFDLQKDKTDPTKDQFFTMGDNSPESQDARIWGPRNSGGQYYPNSFVERQFLIGKAMFIYWPHALQWPLSIPYPSENGLQWLPVTPNVPRMRLVR